MTHEEALEKLELEVGASQQEIQQQYQEFYNEFQMRITNAPTTHQKTLYQKKLKQLEEAYTLLTGKETETLDADLPWSSPGQVTNSSQLQSNQSQPQNNKLNKTHALQLLGLAEPFSKGKLEDAYRVKKNNCKQGIQNAIDEDIARSYKKALHKIEQAYKALLLFAVQPKKQEIQKATLRKSTDFNDFGNKEIFEKINTNILILAGVIVAIVCLLIWSPWSEKIDPIIKNQYTTFKVEGDLLADRNEWKDALEKYNKAYKLMPNRTLKDSILSITRRLKKMISSAENKKWENAKSKNSIQSFNSYLELYPNGYYKTDALHHIQTIIKSQNKIDSNKNIGNSNSSINKVDVFKAIEKNMVFVQGGDFKMGCKNNNSNCGDDEFPQHKVTLSSFKIGKFEVSQAEWYAVMGKKPSIFGGCEDCPVERVSYYDVQIFIKKLNEFTGKKYRLPSEAEWEYAAMGGEKSLGFKYSGSNRIFSVGWSINNANAITHKKGEKQANELGIYDMSGNLFEWCNDWYDKDYYKLSPVKNPIGPLSGQFRVLRGGSWRNSDNFCRVTNRSFEKPSDIGVNIGFRLVLDLN